MLLALLAAFAHATCPDLGERVGAAWALFDDAELEAAKGVIAEAYDGVDCQGRVITADELLALYRLDGLVSLALDDRKGATYATIRAVAADHMAGAPPTEYGPELADMYQMWTDRLAEQLIYIRVAGEGLVWVDGRELDATRYLQVAEGEHLIQTRASGTLRNEILELASDYIVNTGLEGPAPVKLPLPAAIAVPVPVGVPVPAPAPAPIGAPAPARVASGSLKRNRPAALFIGGVASALLGGASIYWASERERVFAASTYDDEIYRGCIKGQSCYDDARLQTIRGDADVVNMGYGAGYGLCGLGTVLVGVGVVGVKPKPTSLSFSWRF
jgi:hypothetical protein